MLGCLLLRLRRMGLVLGVSVMAIGWPAHAQPAQADSLATLTLAIDQQDSDRVRQILADPGLRAAVEKAGQTASLLSDIGQSDGLDIELRRDAFRQAIAAAQADLRTAANDSERAERSSVLYDLVSQNLLFLEGPYFAGRLAGLPVVKGDQKDYFSGLGEVPTEVKAQFSLLTGLLPCNPYLACQARLAAIRQQEDRFNSGQLAQALRLADQAERTEREAYYLFGLREQEGARVRQYEASARTFDEAASLYERAIASLGDQKQFAAAAAKLREFRDRARDRAKYAHDTAKARGPDYDSRPPPPPPPPPAPPPPLPWPPSPPPPAPPPSGPQLVSIVSVALAQSQDTVTAFQRACSPAFENKQSTEVGVYYATSRRPVGQPDSVRELYFGTERVQVTDGKLALNYGRAAVNVPCRRERGDLPRPTTLFILELEQLDSAKHFHLKSVAPLADKGAWINAIDGDVAGSRRREVLVYVHGFNNSFAVASHRAAQLHADLGIDGATVFYSWASHERVLRYGDDRDTVETAEEVAALADTLATLRASGATRVFLVAHSMGNRLMMAALKSLAGYPALQERKFDHLVMGSADIEAKTFTGLWPDAAKIVARTTLYASSRDKAMWAADLFAGERRIGDARNMPQTFAGVSTIETSEVGGAGIGHDDYSRGGMANLQANLWFGISLDRQCILERREAEDGAVYWRIRSGVAEARSCGQNVFADAVEVARLKGSFTAAELWTGQILSPEDRAANPYAAEVRRIIRDISLTQLAPR